MTRLSFPSLTKQIPSENCAAVPRRAFDGWSTEKRTHWSAFAFLRPSAIQVASCPLSLSEKNSGPRFRQAKKRCSSTPTAARIRPTSPSVRVAGWA